MPIPVQMVEDVATDLEAAGGEAEVVFVQAGHGYFTDATLMSKANVQTQEAITAFLADLFGK